MRAEIYSIDSLKSGKLSIMAHPRGRDWLEDEIKALVEEKVDVIVSLLTEDEVGELGLTQEYYICRVNSIIYESFPISDRAVPPLNETTQKFLAKLQSYLAGGKHVAVHCRVGIGRSALIAASLLVQNGFSVDAAFDVLATVRGRNLPDTEEQREWVVEFAKKLKAKDK
ncbi:MAG TPA: dual specificity protein phosphatase family protein [Chloroflexia bacterium]|nr:dual specificity protein phosphatase family protein [Chloroflexia bacterium]